MHTCGCRLNVQLSGLVRSWHQTHNVPSRHGGAMIQQHACDLQISLRRGMNERSVPVLRNDADGDLKLILEM